MTRQGWRSIWTHWAWLVPALLMLPIFFAAAVSEEHNLPNAFQSMATSAIIWLPCLAIIAVLRPRFIAFHATAATAAFLLYDSLRVREILYDGLSPVVDLSGNPNWITFTIIVFCTGVLLAVSFIKTTLYRLVVLIACCAQITTLIMFHQLTVIIPINIASSIEKEFVAEVFAREGSLEVLCGVQGRVCLGGKVEDIAAELEGKDLNPFSTIQILKDETLDLPVLFTWTESAFASTADEAMRHITVLRKSAEDTVVLINEEAPTRSFGQMKIAFSILAGAFQQAWVSLALLILWRHGNYRRSNGRWVRE